MEKLTLTKIYRSDKDKNGVTLKTKDGRPYTKIAVKCKEYGDQYVSGFSAYWNENWQEGQTVQAVVETNNGYLNLKKPDPIAELADKVATLESRIATLEKGSFK